ncbi:hypothetical protein DEO72_LG2g408 [Vigna unguiculata]|uniref:Uncharacterized protein n=1 Tax=Vigna unguiculata TaxID=3917 RepID=A0A4D6KXA5_VIGUN|nr:hypothetical protein DEO72_LG2g408 [Vigna unguiculata]
MDVGREGNGRQPGLWVCERRRGKVLARARRGEKKVMGRGVTELPCGCVQGEEGGVSGNRASCGRELVLGGGIDKLTIGMELRREVGSFSVYADTQHNIDAMTNFFPSNQHGC